MKILSRLEKEVTEIAESLNKETLSRKAATVVGVVITLNRDIDAIYDSEGRTNRIGRIIENRRILNSMVKCIPNDIFYKLFS